MLATLVSILIAAFLWFHPFANEATPTFLGGVIIAVAIPFLFFTPLALIWSWAPLQKAEQNSTPRVMEMFRKDGRIHLGGLWMPLFSLISIVVAIDILYLHAFPLTWLFMGWIILLGLTVDAARGFARRVQSYLNPYSTIEIFTREAKKSVQNDRELDLCHWIDALSEVAIKGIEHHSTSIANLALADQQNVAGLFLDASKSIGHVDQDKQTKELGITDKVSYTLFYLYQRWDVAFEKALKNKLEMTCSHIVTLLGKNTIDAAKYDVSMASAPLRFLGKCARRAQEEGLEETAMTASCTFSEVAKAILTEIDITYYEIKDPFFSIINGMEILAKGAFKRDKNMSIAVLIQPFKELRSLFETGKAKDHQDTPIIVQNIDRILGEFAALQAVMNTLPPLPADLKELQSP